MPFISGYLVEIKTETKKLTAGVHVYAVYGLLILANIYWLYYLLLAKQTVLERWTRHITHP